MINHQQGQSTPPPVPPRKGTTFQHPPVPTLPKPTSSVLPPPKISTSTPPADNINNTNNNPMENSRSMTFIGKGLPPPIPARPPGRSMSVNTPTSPSSLSSSPSTTSTMKATLTPTPTPPPSLPPKPNNRMSVSSERDEAELNLSSPSSLLISTSDQLSTSSPPTISRNTMIINPPSNTNSPSTTGIKIKHRIPVPPSQPSIPTSTTNMATSTTNVSVKNDQPPIPVTSPTASEKGGTNDEDEDDEDIAIQHSTPAPSMQKEKKEKTAEEKETERKELRWEVIAEILKTEENYVEGLNHLNRFYITPLRALGNATQNPKPIITQKDLSFIFDKMVVIKSVNEGFLKQLKALDITMETQDEKPLGQTFKKTLPMFKVYTDYVNNYNNIASKVKDMMKDNPDFDSYMNVSVTFCFFLKYLRKWKETQESKER